MTLVNGWFDWALREPGIPDKVYSDACQHKGLVPHSMEGSYENAKHRLFSTERDPNNPARYSAYAAASWKGSILYDGTLIQHYPVVQATWTSGSRIANISFDAFEFEGKAGQPFTPAQVATLERLIRELSEHYRWEPVRPMNATDLAATLYEHREMVRFGAAPTACPSGRIPWVQVLEELDVTQKDKDDIVNALKGYIDMRIIQLIAYLQQTGVKVKE